MTVRAVVYVEGRRPGTGERLAADVNAIVDRVGRDARSFPRTPVVGVGEIRQALVRRFGYWLVFELPEGQPDAIVLALWHGRRRPEGWRSNEDR